MIKHLGSRRLSLRQVTSVAADREVARLKDNGNGDSGSNGLMTRMRERAFERANSLPPEASKIVAIWNTEYATRLTEASSPLHLKHLCVQTNQIGTSYYERTLTPRPDVSEALVGHDVLHDFIPEIWNIAALDAFYGNLIRDPDEEHILEGSAPRKASERSTIVCNEVRRIADKLEQPNKALRVANVGVVGDIIKDLVDANFQVTATDHYKAIVGTKVNGVMVRPARVHRELVEKADIALVTGMTLANDTLDGIIESAREHGTRLVLFAQTGANFAEEYVEAGADSVISEPFPFYLSGSKSCRIRVYRRD